MSTCEVDGPSACQCADENDGKQADTEKDALPVTRASSNHRRSMTLLLQAMPHLNIALGLSSSPSPSLGSSKAGEGSLQAEKDEQVVPKPEQASDEANTTEDPPELYSTPSPLSTPYTLQNLGWPLRSPHIPPCYTQPLHATHPPSVFRTEAIPNLQLASGRAT